MSFWNPAIDDELDRLNYEKHLLNVNSEIKIEKDRLEEAKKESLNSKLEIITFQLKSDYVCFRTLRTDELGDGTNMNPYKNRFRFIINGQSFSDMQHALLERSNQLIILLIDKLK